MSTPFANDPSILMDISIFVVLFFSSGERTGPTGSSGRSDCTTRAGSKRTAGDSRKTKVADVS
jgi:hypothetical protein